jgi:hypothetical protein
MQNTLKANRTLLKRMYLTMLIGIPPQLYHRLLKFYIIAEISDTETTLASTKLHNYNIIISNNALFTFAVFIYFSPLMVAHFYLGFAGFCL